MNKEYQVYTVTGTKPTKKDPDIKKVPAKEKLKEFLNDLPFDEKVIAILPGGFSGYQVVTCAED